MATNPKSLPGPPKIMLARLGQITKKNVKGAEGVNDNDWIDVHFNPTSLQLQLSNSLKDTDKQERKQHTALTTTKLTMELQFDTTDSGANVLNTTGRIQLLVAPRVPDQNRKSKKTPPPPPVVFFEWVGFTFQGIIESYNETIDYFSGSGIPLRSSVKLTLSQQNLAFEPSGNSDPPPNDDVSAPARSPSEAAEKAGDSSANRGIAAANGEESLRFSAGASLTVSGGVTLKPPSGFASVGGGAGFGIGGGIGGGVNLGGGAGFSLSAGASVGIDGGAGISGLAKLSATEGAFAGLRTNVSVSTPRLNPSRLLPVSGSGVLATGSGASFQLGGRASVQGAAGLRADVGASGSMNSKIQFD